MGFLFIIDFLLNYFLIFICVLVRIAFLTLLERKVLGLSQVRKGPNKVGYVGLLQPFADGLKLFSKEEIFVFNRNKLFFFLSPFFSFVLFLVVWSLYSSFRGFLELKLSLFFFLFCIRLSVYGIIMSGWGSNSKYSFLGSLRAVAQTVSYELFIRFGLFLICLVFFSYSVQDIRNEQNFSFMGFYLFLFLIMFFVSLVVETNRAPFDLAEGESELVSGFNTEYAGLKFSLIFLAEYGRIIWMCFIISLLFFGNFLMFWVFILVFLWFRSSYPRFRYDFLIKLLWKNYLLIILWVYYFIVI